ncbi:MAG TPA: hypothetical protein VHZ97_17620, partial [Pseudonocardiaceae bacterium]|nr:hypothetical protein [Pseudonocardiaceae bacterium]
MQVNQIDRGGSSMLRRYPPKLSHRVVAAALMVFGLVGSAAVPANAAPDRVNATNTANATPTTIGLAAASAELQTGSVNDVFVTKSDGNLYQRTGNGQWLEFAGPPSGIGFSPTATWVNDGSRLDVFVTANDGHIYQKTWFAAGSSTDWVEFSGASIAGPTATWTQQGTRLDLFVDGTDGRLYQKTWVAGSGWSDWIAFSAPPSGMKGAPSATDPADGSRLDVFATGNDS